MSAPCAICRAPMTLGYRALVTPVGPCCLMCETKCRTLFAPAEPEPDDLDAAYDARRDRQAEDHHQPKTNH